VISIAFQLLVNWFKPASTLGMPILYTRLILRQGGNVSDVNGIQGKLINDVNFDVNLFTLGDLSMASPPLKTRFDQNRSATGSPTWDWLLTFPWHWSRI
jgi:hypothetical protein